MNDENFTQIKKMLIKLSLIAQCLISILAFFSAKVRIFSLFCPFSAI